jgi:hypothetical protein
MDFSSYKLTRHIVCAAMLMLTAWTARADTPTDEHLLGMAEQDVVVAVPGVRKIARPVMGPHGLRGLLTLTPSVTAGLSGEMTFYFRKRLLERIEERRRLPETQCKNAFSMLLSNLSTRYGVGVYSDGDNANDGENGSAAWVLENFKVMAYRLQAPNQCDLLVAIEQHEQKDATEL